MRGKKRATERVGLCIFKDHLIVCHDVINSSRLWARRGYGAEIFAVDTGRIPQPAIGEEGVRLRLTRTLYGRLLGLGRRLGGINRKAAVTPAGVKSAGGGRSSALRPLLNGAAWVLSGLQKYEFTAATALRLLTGRFRLVVAFDTPSLFAARLNLLLRGVPYVYHSRELVLTWDLESAAARIEKAIERHCHRRAALTLIQDRTRAGLLGRDNSVPADRFHIVPNAPLGEYRGGPTTAVAERVGLPARTPVVLYAGSVTEETMMREAVESIVGWPGEAVLVIHGDVNNAYRPTLEAAAARYPGRVLISNEYLQPDEVDAFFAGAAAGLALYKPVNDNFRCVGHAAGKIFNFIKVGVPVVSNDLPGLRELLDDNGCGRTVSETTQIGEALRCILSDPGGYRERCLSTFARYEFSRSYQAAMERMEELSAADRSPRRSG